MKPHSVLLTLCFLMPLAISPLISLVCAQDPPYYSELWGKQGEKWTASSRLPDFSYAGYYRGERSLPTRTADVSVSDFGAIGDGQADDTKAFQRAIDESAGKTIAVPPGVYRITDILEIRKSGTVLQGAGSGKSTLTFPIPLNEIRPNWGATTTGQRTSNYSWSGGFISIVGTASSKKLASVMEPAQRGEQSVIVSTIDQIQEGDEIRLMMSDTSDQTLAKYLYANDPGDLKNLGQRTSVSFVARVTHIDSDSKRVEFNRPLLTDVQLDWQPLIYAASCSVEDVGVEKLGFAFPPNPYEGHFQELGFNAIAMSGVRNCWLRDLHIENADSGIFMHATNTTIDGIVFESQRRVEPQRQATGHHGVTLGGQDNLLTHFDFRTRFIHDITVSGGSAGNVSTNGRGLDMCFDHHCHAPYANLFANIDIGAGTRMFQSGGGQALGRHSAAWQTFWCIRSQAAQEWPTNWGPNLMNLVGVTSADNQSMISDDPNGRWFEAIEPTRLQPADLHQAQLNRRMGKPAVAK